MTETLEATGGSEALACPAPAATRLPIVVTLTAMVKHQMPWRAPESSLVAAAVDWHRTQLLCGE